MDNQRIERLLKRYGKISSVKSWDFYITNRRITQYRLNRQLQTILTLTKQAIHDHPEPSILDVGCGSGRYLTNFLPLGKTFGVDVSQEMLRVANENTLGKATLVHADAENLPFESNTFDVVVCSNLLENLNGPEDSPVKVVQEMFRVTKKGGIAIVGVETWYSIMALHNYLTCFFHNKRPLNWYGLRKGKNLVQEVNPSSYQIYNISPATIFLPEITKGLLKFINSADTFLEKMLPPIGVELIFELKK